MARKYKIRHKVNNWFSLAKKIYGAENERMAFKLMRANPGHTNFSEGTAIIAPELEKGFFVSHGEAARARGEFDFSTGTPTQVYRDAVGGIGDNIPPVPSQPQLQPGQPRTLFPTLPDGRPGPRRGRGRNLDFQRQSSDPYYYANIGLEESPFSAEDVFGVLHKRDLPGTRDRRDVVSEERRRSLGRPERELPPTPTTGTATTFNRFAAPPGTASTGAPQLPQAPPGTASSISTLPFPAVPQGVVPPQGPTGVLGGGTPTIPGGGFPATTNLLPGIPQAPPGTASTEPPPPRIPESVEATEEQMERIRREQLTAEQVVQDYLLQFQQDATFVDENGVVRIDFEAMQEKLDELPDENLAMLVHFGYIEPYQETSAAYTDYGTYAPGSGYNYGYPGYGGYSYPRYNYPSGGSNFRRRANSMGLVSWRI